MQAGAIGQKNLLLVAASLPLGQGRAGWYLPLFATKSFFIGPWMGGEVYERRLWGLNERAAERMACPPFGCRKRSISLTNSF